MKTLIKRELDGMDLAKGYQNKIRAFISIYGFLGLGFPVILWMLGPGIGLLSGESMNTSVFVVGLVISWQAVSLHIFREDAHGQLTFLQTLPVTSQSIIHAKFTSVLVFCIPILIWMFTVAGLNSVVSGVDKSELWLGAGFFCSLIIFTEGISLLTYFTRGADKINIMYWVFFGVWAVLFVLSSFFMKTMGKEDPDSYVFAAYIFVSFLVYILCWAQALRKVKKQGFPTETGNKANQIGAVDTLEKR